MKLTPSNWVKPIEGVLLYIVMMMIVGRNSNDDMQKPI